MKEIYRIMSTPVTAQRALRIALLATLSFVMLALSACQSSRPISERMESKYSLKKRKNSISCLRSVGRERCTLPVKVSERSYETMLKSIEQLKGIKFHYGGTTRKGFDCSGFVQYLYAKAFNLALPRVSYNMALVGSMVPREQLERGDLLFFAFEGDVSHVGVYLGDGRFAHASSVAKKVTISSLKERSYAKHFAFGARIIKVQE